MLIYMFHVENAENNAIKSKWIIPYTCVPLLKTFRNQTNIKQNKNTLLPQHFAACLSPGSHKKCGEDVQAENVWLDSRKRGGDGADCCKHDEWCLGGWARNSFTLHISPPPFLWCEWKWWCTERNTLDKPEFLETRTGIESESVMVYGWTLQGALPYTLH